MYKVHIEDGLEELIKRYVGDKDRGGSIIEVLEDIGYIYLMTNGISELII